VLRDRRSRNSSAGIGIELLVGREEIVPPVSAQTHPARWRTWGSRPWTRCRITASTWSKTRPCGRHFSSCVAHAKRSRRSTSSTPAGKRSRPIRIPIFAW